MHHQGTRKREADSNRRQHAFLGALAVWLQSPYCFVYRLEASKDFEPSPRGAVRRGEIERGSEVRRMEVNAV